MKGRILFSEIYSKMSVGIIQGIYISDFTNDYAGPKRVISDRILGGAKGRRPPDSGAAIRVAVGEPEEAKRKCTSTF